jgi:hypothetical protein
MGPWAVDQRHRPPRARPRKIGADKRNSEGGSTALTKWKAALVALAAAWTSPWFNGPSCVKPRDVISAPIVVLQSRGPSPRQRKIPPCRRQARLSEVRSRRTSTSPRSGGRRQVPLDHHPHIVKRRRRHHAGNDERLWERPGPIWTRQRSRPAVGAFAAGRPSSAPPLPQAP